MKWTELFQSMTEDEFSECGLALHEEVVRRRTGSDLTQTEIILIENSHATKTEFSRGAGFVQAVKSYRDRTRSTLGEAKRKCDAYYDSLGK